jgi:integrase
MASIRKRGPAQWEARIRKRGWPVTCKTFDTKIQAEQWARQIESEMDRGVFISRAEAESTTLGEALGRYIQEYIPSLSDSQRETNRARAIQRRELSARFLASIRGKDIADLIRERQAEGVGPNTIRLDLALLSRLFEVAASDWGMESLSNPVRKANKPRLPSGRSRRLEEGEQESLLAASPPHFRAVVEFALETAMRREEIATLTWPQVDLKKRVLTLPKTKNGEARTVPLSPAALTILGKLPRAITGAPVFGMSKQAITKTMLTVCRRVGIENLRFHDLRHEATSRFFEETDLDVMEIRAITGHKAMQMLARYSHLRADRLSMRLSSVAAKRLQHNKSG